jgi:hypothetical protein
MITTTTMMTTTAAMTTMTVTTTIATTGVMTGRRAREADRTAAASYITQSTPSTLALSAGMTPTTPSSWMDHVPFTKAPSTPWVSARA